MPNQSGAVKLSTILWFSVIASLIYAATKLAPPYVRDYQIEEFVKHAARRYADDRYRPGFESYLVWKLREMELPVTADQFEVVEQDGKVTVSIAWEYEVVWIPANPVVEEYKETLKFYHEATEELK